MPCRCLLIRPRQKASNIGAETRSTRRPRLFYRTPEPFQNQLSAGRHLTSSRVVRRSAKEPYSSSNTCLRVRIRSSFSYKSEAGANSRKRRPRFNHRLSLRQQCHFPALSESRLTKRGPSSCATFCIRSLWSERASCSSTFGRSCFAKPLTG